MNTGDTWVSTQPGISGNRILVWVQAFQGSTGPRFRLQIWPYLPEGGDYYARLLDLSPDQARLYVEWALELNQWMTRYVEQQEQRWSIQQGLQQYHDAAEQRFKEMMVELIGSGGAFDHGDALGAYFVERAR
jgi:hypothetical protein